MCGIEIDESLLFPAWSQVAVEGLLPSVGLREANQASQVLPSGEPVHHGEKNVSSIEREDWQVCLHGHW